MDQGLCRRMTLGDWLKHSFQFGKLPTISLLPAAIFMVKLMGFTYRVKDGQKSRSLIILLFLVQNSKQIHRNKALDTNVFVFCV